MERSDETLAIAVVATEADKKSRRENNMELAFDLDCLERKQLTPVSWLRHRRQPGLAPDGSPRTDKPGQNQRSPGEGGLLFLPDGKVYGTLHHSLLKMQRLQHYRSEVSAS